MRANNKKANKLKCACAKQTELIELTRHLMILRVALVDKMDRFCDRGRYCVSCRHANKQLAGAIRRRISGSLINWSHHSFHTSSLNDVDIEVVVCATQKLNTCDISEICAFPNSNLNKKNPNFIAVQVHLSTINDITIAPNRGNVRKSTGRKANKVVMAGSRVCLIET